MKSPFLLSENHTRVLGVVVRQIERSLAEIEELFNRGQSGNSILHRIEKSYSESERHDILEKVTRLRGRLQQFAREFRLTSESFTEYQIVDTKVTHMWMLLEDSFSQKLNGYGQVDESISGRLDESVAELLTLVRELKRLK